MAEQKSGNMAENFEYTVEWQDNVTGDENCMGYREDMPIDICEEKNMQKRRLDERSEPMDQMDKEIEDISILIMEETKKETKNGERWNNEEPTTST
jgi:hypothetical protein